MDLIDKIQTLSKQANKLIEHIKTEEAAKTSLIMPFINALGYNVFDPTEVVPEFTADVGTKKAEKVDYAIFLENKPIILFECKHCGQDLNDANYSQLFRYFTVTEAKFAVLTNGISYKFFTDSDETNKLDQKPFYEFNLFNFKDKDIEELKKFSKSLFNVEETFTAAIELKYKREIKNIFHNQLNNPHKDFVKFFVSSVFSGRTTPTVLIQFTELVKKALNEYISDRVNERIQSALQQDISSDKGFENKNETQTENNQIGTEKKEDDGIITTAEELDGYYLIRSLIREFLDINRVVARDTKSYFGILLDNNNRKPICRLHLNTSNKYISLFDNNREEEKILIDSLDDIYRYRDRLKNTIEMYDKQ